MEKIQKVPRCLPKKQIFLLDNVISDDLCDEIIHIINTTKTKKERYGPSKNVHADYCYPKDIECKSKSKEIDDKINEVFIKIVHNNFNNVGSTIRGDTGYLLRKIEGPTKIHVDGVTPCSVSSGVEYVNMNQIRVMSLIIALNSDYEGGEFCFPEQNVMVKLKRGQAIAFPPSWTHPHYTKDLLNNTVRYTITSWLTQ
jgi:hypothetical protein